MGSFANSLHVKCPDVSRVKQTIEELMAKEGWTTTTELPDATDARFGMSSTRRALHLAAPQSGWVSILDSDLTGECLLAAELARRLDTYALMVMVNDSDSWCYTLHRGARQLDEFESGEGANEDDAELPGDMQELTAALGSLQKMMSDGSLMERMDELQKQAQADMPPEMKEIQARVQAGQATSEEIARFQEWFAGNNPTLNEQIEQMLGQILPSGILSRAKKKPRKPAKTRSPKIDNATKKRIELLRPLLASDAGEEELHDVFGAQATFAEETLADFLPLVDIPGYYAYLSYGYLDESTPGELGSHSIRFVHHLKYAAPDA